VQERPCWSSPRDGSAQRVTQAVWPPARRRCLRTSPVSQLVSPSPPGRRSRRRAPLSTRQLCRRRSPCGGAAGGRSQYVATPSGTRRILDAIAPGDRAAAVLGHRRPLDLGGGSSLLVSSPPIGALPTPDGVSRINNPMRRAAPTATGKGDGFMLACFSKRNAEPTSSPG
jgi:hypothetical protein